MQKNLEIREGRQGQWNPTSTPWNIFFLWRDCAYKYIHSARFLKIFRYALFVFPEKWMQKNLDIRGGRQEKWNPTSAPWIFFFLSREFSYIHSERFFTFFLCCVRISRIMNAKKSRNSRGKTRAMESHFYTMEYFFSLTRLCLQVYTFCKIP